MATAPFRVKAVFEYTSSHEDDLAFKIGQIITVTDEEDSEWYGGEYVDETGVKQEGIFPRNFVEKFEPTAPPRPTRARKKEAEPASLAPSSPPPVPTTAAPPEPPVDEALTETTSGDIHEEAPPAGNTHLSEAPSVPVANPPEITPVPALAPIESKDVDPVGSASLDAPPPQPQPEPPYTIQPRSPPPNPSQFSPPIQPRSPPPAQARSPPPVSQKPSSNSFRDRIAAFNKPAAPPVAPFKPSGLGSGSSGFIKKPFVAPPPSRHAFVPPPRDNSATRVYRREKDTETQEARAGPIDPVEKAGSAPTASSEPGDEDQPKPTTLKERIALLQKQQAEAAQRHADALAKKEKPARPPKKQIGGNGPQEATASDQAAVISPSLERKDPNDVTIPGKESLDDPREDNGNMTAMPDTGDTTARPEVPVQHGNNEDNVEKQVSREGTAPQEQPAAEGEEAEEEEEEEEDIDPEVRRKEELRARMAKMSGGMGMAGMFGPPGMLGLGGSLPAKKPKPPMPERRLSGMPETPSSPIPARIALPGLGIQKQPEEVLEPEPKQEPAEEVTSPVPVYSTTSPEIESTPQPSGAPPVPGGRPAPPPIPVDSRPPPPPPPAAVASPSVGSESDDEMSESTPKPVEAPEAEASPKGREPPRVPMTSPPLPTSPCFSSDNRSSNVGEEASPASPSFPSQQSKRNSRPPPPIPGAAPAAPSQTRPPPPPPPATAPSRTSTANELGGAPMEPGRLDNGEEQEEATEYDGDYDTDITSSAHHKDALKAHARGSSFDGSSSIRSPTAEYPSKLPPPVPSSAAPRTGPPPVPSQPAPPSRGSVDVPRAARAPPPPKQTQQTHDDDYDPYNYNTAQTPPPPSQDAPTHEEKEYPPSQAQAPAQPSSSTDHRAPIAPTGSRVPPRKSADILRPSIGRRSVDVGRHSISMETGFMANEIDLSDHSQWWLSGPGVPPAFLGRKDIHTESTETKSTEEGRQFVTKEILILFPDYSQTMITVRFDPSDSSETELDQRHEPPPRPLRQDELEEAYERFGRQLAQSAASKKDTIVGDGTPNAFLYDLLQTLKGALPPVGTRAYGALVYANLANAATQLNDEIRPGDIISIRNAKFQGKHGPMHARYTMEVGKPDHVAIVAEWDGTKKKVRAWEQGRENKKVKQESFKLEDLRSGEVKIWRVMPRTWVGWELKE